MKAEYNELLARYYKAEKYFESQAPYDEKIKHLESFKNILKGLNSLLLGIKDYKQEEILGGLNVEINKIYNMDCLEGMKAIPDNSIDLVVMVLKSI